jgi:hypothetical protein
MKMPGIPSTERIPWSQPPRKKSALRADLRIILLYSARKNSAKPIAEYSTLYPDTSSASASGRSKGCRFVSASVVTKKIRKIGNSGKTSQTLFWVETRVEKFRDPANSRIDTRVEPSATSYEIIWAADRSPPRKAYLELLDHPAIITEWTLSEEIAKIYRIPRRKSDSIDPSPIGNTAHPASASAKVKTGDSRKI